MFEKFRNKKITITIILVAVGVVLYWIEVRPTVLVKTCYRANKTNEHGFTRCLLEHGYPVQLNSDF